jgi:uncharacterized protein (DUF3820 family)
MRYLPGHRLPRLWHYARLDPATHSFMKPEDLQRLLIQTMPYGKYKGRLIADLPGHYLNWFARVGFPPGDLGRLLARFGRIRRPVEDGLCESLNGGERRLQLV